MIAACQRGRVGRRNRPAEPGRRGARLPRQRAGRARRRRRLRSTSDRVRSHGTEHGRGYRRTGARLLLDHDGPTGASGRGTAAAARVGGGRTEDRAVLAGRSRRGRRARRDAWTSPGRRSDQLHRVQRGVPEQLARTALRRVSRACSPTSTSAGRGFGCVQSQRSRAPTSPWARLVRSCSGVSGSVARGGGARRASTWSRARDLFEQLGAGRWIERCEHELIAAGGASRIRPTTRMTPTAC